jgi:hypothetical protein
LLEIVIGGQFVTNHRSSFAANFSHASFHDVGTNVIQNDTLRIQSQVNKTMAYNSENHTPPNWESSPLQNIFDHVNPPPNTTLNNVPTPKGSFIPLDKHGKATYQALACIALKGNLRVA